MTAEPKPTGFEPTTDTAGADDGQFDAVALLRALRKYWPLTVAICAAIGLAVTFFTLGQTRIYSASATVMFDPAPPRPLGREVNAAEYSGGDYWTNQEFYATQLQLLTSKRIARAVVDDLGLNKDAGFIRNAAPNAKVVSDEISPDTAAGILLERLSVQPVKNTRLATVTYEDANPERAQRIALAVVEVYIAKNVEDTQSSTTSAVEWLNEQTDKLKGNLDSNEMALHQFQIDKNILAVDVVSQSNMLRDEMTTVNQALTAARIRRVELEARHSALEHISPEDPSKIPSTELLNSDMLRMLRRNYLEALTEHDTLLAGGKGENHPMLQQAKAKLEVSRTALVNELANIKGAIAHDLAAVRKQEAGLSGLLEAAKKQALDVNLLAIEYNRLLRNKDNSEKLYGMVLERAKEGDLTRMMAVNDIRIVERPSLPRSPIRPRLSVNLPAGFGAGLVLGIAAALALYLLDRSVKSQAQVESVLKLNFLGILPIVGSEQGKRSRYYGRYRGKPAPAGSPAELVVHEAPASGTAEAARSIRTNIHFMSPDKPLRVLLVTSANPSEGKTTVACTLAITMAQAGQRVCLVDCDLRRPRVHRIFGKSSDSGVTAVLIDDGALTDDLLATEIPSLSALPAGPIPPNPAELLQSARFAALLHTLRGRFDRVVIDSSPVGPVTDAAILATQVDGIVMVIRAGETSRDAVLDAKRTLVGVGGRVVGAVLNSVDLRGAGYGGYRYAYYRRGGYYRHEEPAQADGSSL